MGRPIGMVEPASPVTRVSVDQTVASVGQWGPYAVLAALAVLTMLFTEIVTNTAAAALMSMTSLR